MEYRIIYPELKVVDEKTLRSWYADYMTTEWMRYASDPKEGPEWDAHVDAKWNQYFADDWDEIVNEGLFTLAR